MAWRQISNSHRKMAIVIAVTGLHAFAAAFILSHVTEFELSPSTTAIEIELADLAPPSPPAVETPPKPEIRNEEPVMRPRQTTPSPAEASSAVTEPEPSPSLSGQATQNAETPGPASAPPSPPNTQEVLTQLEQDIWGAQTPSGGTTPGSGGVSSAQIAAALQQAECLNLKRRTDETCPPEDPFEIALALEESAVPPERLAPDPRYVSLSVSDKIFQREAANRFHWPDADMFTDPLAAGVYNARRIRNGQEPLWSQDMRDGFRKDE